MRGVAGGLLALLGMTLALRSGILLLGRGRPRRGPRPALVIAGPYTRMRNPLLAGLILALAGVALASGSATAGAVTGVLALVAHLWVTRIEEPRLRRRFGTAYEAYLTHVPRWCPRLGRQRSPDPQ